MVCIKYGYVDVRKIFKNRMFSHDITAMTCNRYARKSLNFGNHWIWIWKSLKINIANRRYRIARKGNIKRILPQYRILTLFLHSQHFHPTPTTRVAFNGRITCRAVRGGCLCLSTSVCMSFFPVVEIRNTRDLLKKRHLFYQDHFPIFLFLKMMNQIHL